MLMKQKKNKKDLECAAASRRGYHLHKHGCYQR